MGIFVIGNGREFRRSGIVDFENLSNRIAGMELLDSGTNTDKINIYDVANIPQALGNRLQPLVSILADANRNPSPFRTDPTGPEK